jgi:hypothetical protein
MAGITQGVLHVRPRPRFTCGVSEWSRPKGRYFSPQSGACKRHTALRIVGKWAGPFGKTQRETARPPCVVIIGPRPRNHSEFAVGVRWRQSR